MRIRRARPTPARPGDCRLSVLSTRLLLQSSLPTALHGTRVTPRRIRDFAGANYDELVRGSGEARAKKGRTRAVSGHIRAPRGTRRMTRKPAVTRDFGQQKTGFEGRFIVWSWWWSGPQVRTRLIHQRGSTRRSLHRRGKLRRGSTLPPWPRSCDACSSDRPRSATRRELGTPGRDCLGLLRAPHLCNGASNSEPASP